MASTIPDFLRDSQYIRGKHALLDYIVATDDS